MSARLSPCKNVVDDRIPRRLRGNRMGCFEGSDCNRTTLLPESLDDWIDEGKRVRVIDAFVDATGLGELGFDGVVPEARGPPAYNPAVLLKLYIYGLPEPGAVESTAGAEGRTQLRGDVADQAARSRSHDHKTIADFRKDNGRAIRQVCIRFVGLCREMGFLAAASLASDGSKFKAVNNRDRNFTRAKMARRRLNRGERRALPAAARHRRPAGALRCARVRAPHSLSYIPRLRIPRHRLNLWRTAVSPRCRRLGIARPAQRSLIGTSSRAATPTSWCVATPPPEIRPAFSSTAGGRPGRHQRSISDAMADA